MLEEIVIPANHSHTYETVTIEPTCTVDGQTVTRCSVCLEEKEKTIIPATGHDVDETIREATFTQTGSVFRFCMTCNAVLESSTLPKLDPLCTDDGDIHITDNKGLRVNAKSLLGAMYSLEFEELWCESEFDIYRNIEDFIIV